MTDQMMEAMPLLRSRGTMSKILPLAVEMNRLENEADRVLHRGLARLVKERGDWFEFERWKDIFEALEEATDKAEDVADVLMAVVTKHA